MHLGSCREVSRAVPHYAEGKMSRDKRFPLMNRARLFPKGPISILISMHAQQVAEEVRCDLYGRGSGSSRSSTPG